MRLFLCSSVLVLLVSGMALAEGENSVRTKPSNNNSVQLDRTQQRIALDMEPTFGAEFHALPTLPGTTGMVPAGLLAQKAKQFDDGLYAAVELAAEQGAGTFAGKAAMLRAVAAPIAQGTPNAGSSTWLAAMLLNGSKLDDLPAEQVGAAQWRARTFLENPLVSKPIGFYTWSQPLQAIFLQDRMLQQPVHPETSLLPLVSALAHDPVAATTYTRYLQLVSQLTNPFAYPDLRPAIAAAQAGTSPIIAPETRIIPPSMAHETELLKRLFGDMPIPDGYSLVDDLIGRVRAGSLDLHPRTDSGWYDWQTWSLETLLIPERAPEAGHLQLSAGYQGSLQDLFKGLFALQRETHIKQLEVPVVLGSAAFHHTVTVISPRLQVEPQATYYLRRALGYRFVRGVLLNTFGEAGLASMHRLSPEGPSTKNLSDELADMESLFLGAYAAANSDLGLPVDGDPAAPSALSSFQDWRKQLAQDPDLSRDARMMVPLFYDRQRMKTKVLVFLGWRSQPLGVSYAHAPKILPQPKDVQVRFGHDEETVLTPVTAEIYVSKQLNRQEFRALCDQYQTPDAIIQALQGVH